MNSTASLALIDTGPGWKVTLAVVAAFLIGVAVEAIAGSFRKAATSQDTTVDYVLSSDPRCMVQVCDAPSSVSIHGWETCDEHAVIR